jgi:Ca2+/H+ antiporter
MDALSVYAIVGWSMFHLAALISAWATRMTCGSRLESAMQLIFFAAMAAVGGAAAIARHLDIGAWPASAIVLVAMVLTAVVDFRRLGEATHAPSQVAGC